MVLPTQASKEPQVLPQKINAVPTVLVLILGFIYNIKFRPVNHVVLILVVGFMPAVN